MNASHLLSGHDAGDGPHRAGTSPEVSPEVPVPIEVSAQASGCASSGASTDAPAVFHPRAPQADETFRRREADWRQGAVVYQVLVDRFAPPADLDAKRHLYPSPKQLKRWDETPRHGRYLEDQKLWSHEIDFWGGDLASLAGRLDHVQQLGATVLYLNPIHLAYTNHKYDALDYLQISPEYGSRDDLRALAAQVHRRGMKLVLDGVFNHMGRHAPRFRQAEADPSSPWRDWFVFGPHFPGGARCWWNAQNLPELQLEHPAVRAHLYGAPDSVVRSLLRDGADGWRLDVAVDLGFRWLDELTRAAHEEKPGSLVVGEIPAYPSAWLGPVDGAMNFTLREIVLRLAAGSLSADRAQAFIERMVADVQAETGSIEPLLKSWLFLDNHDTRRLADVLPDADRRRLAQVLQFTLPGSPNLYYGSEVGMTGGDDPQMRAPMRWDRVQAEVPELRWTRRLIAMHRRLRALRIGDFRRIESRRLLAFERHTDRAADTVVVLANPSDEAVSETVLVGNASLMHAFMMRDELTEEAGCAPAPVRIQAGLLEVTVPARGARVLTPELSPGGGYSAYKRVP